MLSVLHRPDKDGPIQDPKTTMQRKDIQVVVQYYSKTATCANSGFSAPAALQLKYPAPAS